MQQSLECYALHTCYYAHGTVWRQHKLCPIASYRLFTHAQVIIFTDATMWTGVQYYCSDVLSFSIFQRLKPNDPTLSFRICERQTFSLRQDREMRYSIRVQCSKGEHDFMFDTGLQSKKFGLGSKTSCSEVLTLDGLSLPIYASYLMLFPPS